MEGWMVVVDGGVARSVAVVGCPGEGCAASDGLQVNSCKLGRVVCSVQANEIKSTKNQNNEDMLDVQNGG